MSNEAPRKLDSRLPQLGVTLTKAQVAEGEPYWRIVDVKWWDKREANELRHIYVEIVDEQGKRIVGAKAIVGWAGGQAEVTTEDKTAPEYGGNFAMQGAGCSYWIEAVGFPSDRLNCMGLGSIEQRDWTVHVCYLVTFQRATKGGGGTPDEALRQALLNRGEAERKIRLNPGAALQKAMLADNFVPTSGEFDLTHNGAHYTGQIAERLSDGAVRVYFGDIVNGQWAGNVRFVQR